MTFIYILAAIFIFGVLIALHEFGHFAAAKLCGVRVNEFSIGMGPLLWQKQTEETQYSLRLLPIGGFCALDEDQPQSAGDERSFVRQSFWFCCSCTRGRLASTWTRLRVLPKASRWRARTA